MEHLNSILQWLYDTIDEKGMFIPLSVSNAIIGFKFAHNDEVYWMNFKRKAAERKIHNIKELYMFYIDFLPQYSKDSKSLNRKIAHIKEFDIFLNEILFKQKYYFKNPDQFSKILKKGLVKTPNPLLIKFVEDIFAMSSKIKFDT